MIDSLIKAVLESPYATSLIAGLTANTIYKYMLRNGTNDLIQVGIKFLIKLLQNIDSLLSRNEQGNQSPPDPNFKPQPMPEPALNEVPVNTLHSLDALPCVLGKGPTHIEGLPVTVKETNPVSSDVGHLTPTNGED
jgi:hypothetical protein